MKNYLQKIKNNIWDHVYYEEVLVKPLSSSFKYYIKMSLWLTLIYTAFVSVVFLPNFINTAKLVISNMAQVYPAELKVHLFNGQASVNVPEPIIITLPADVKNIFKSVEKKIGSLENLIVIDTRTNFELAEFNNYRALFVLKKDALAGVNNDGSVQVSNVPAGNMIISGTDIKNIADKIQSAIFILAPISVLVIYFLGILFFFFTIGYLIVVALFAWLLLYVAKRDITFKQSLGLTLHACTFALLINFFVFALYPSLSVNFPFLVTFTLLILYLNLIRKPKLVVVALVAPTEIPVDTVAKAEEAEAKAKEEEKKAE